MTILTKEETNKCLADIDIALSQMDAIVYENEALKAELTHAQSYKADAEKYKELQKINCPVEGLSIRLEYRDGDIIFCNKRSFSILEVKHLPTITDQIRWSANW